MVNDDVEITLLDVSCAIGVHVGDGGRSHREEASWSSRIAQKLNLFTRVVGHNGHGPGDDATGGVIQDSAEDVARASSDDRTVLVNFKLRTDKMRVLC